MLEKCGNQGAIVCEAASTVVVSKSNFKQKTSFYVSVCVGADAVMWLRSVEMKGDRGLLAQVLTI